MKIRFLPYMIIASLLMLIVKIDEAVESSKDFANIFSAAKLEASEKKEETKEESAGEQKEKNSEHEKPKEDKQELKISDVKPKEFDCKKTNFSDADLTILENLAKRRQEIEKSSNELITKQALLNAAEEKLTQKLQELKNLKSEVSGLLDQYNNKEDMKITSLVKIYENMKPKEAAKIFEGLEMSLLLQVLDKMKEAKSAPILAQMNPQKATEVTVEFAKQKKFDPIAN